MAETKIVAVCGKGGVGKTSISALMVKLLASDGRRRILAIDADPATGLALALGVKVQKTVDDIRKDLITGIKSGNTQDKSAMLKDLDFEVFSALEQEKGFALLAIGRPEDEGCFCKVNSLLKEIINDLAGKFDVVIIDGEAGIEQINRRVMKSVDDLVLVSDISAKGIRVASAIKHVAQDNKAIGGENIGLIINRVKKENEVKKILSDTPFSLLGWIPEDDLIREYDFYNKPLINLPDTSPSVSVVRGVLEKLAL